MYQEGLGVPQDDAEAVSWYHKAAARNHAEAQLRLGAMYELGRGAPQDLPLALMWFTLAAAAGNKDAAGRAEMAETKMSAPQLEKSREMKKEWLEKHRE
jgi:hypothetical protein